MVGDVFRTGIDRERRCARPCAADPMLPADLRAVLSEPLQAVPALGDIRAHEDEGLPIRCASAGNEGHARWRRMRGHPAAGVISR